MKKLAFILFSVFIFLFQDTLVAQINGQTPIDPTAIPQFVDPLPHFAGQRVDASGGNLIIKHVPAQQIAVSTGTVLTDGVVGTDPDVGKGNYWTYSISNDGGSSFTPALWPSFSIEAQRGIPVQVVYENNLDGQTYADVNLVVDQTLHWADPFDDYGSFSPYTAASVPVVPHLHGGEVASESDGGPDAWFTPGMAQTGPSWGIDGTDENYYYPNTQEEATLWYHDHSLGVTRLNVYAGLAGFYFLRGPEEEAAQLPGWSGDDLVQEVAPPGTYGTFNPEPYLPEIEIAIQDRMFDTDGGLYFPNEPSNPGIHPIWTPEFVGDVITVNGKTWPYLSVAPRKYRFRLLNGSNARFYNMTLEGAAPVIGNKIPFITQIGTDGGLMDAPVPINSHVANSPLSGGNLLLAPGERADVVIDFSKVDIGSEWILMNSAGTPFPFGDGPVTGTTDRIMKFVVNGKMVSATGIEIKPGKDNSKLPPILRTPMVKLSDFAGGITVTPDKIRQLTLNEIEGPEGPLEALVNNTKWDGNGMDEEGLGITEYPVEGETELWQIINLTGDAHPIHVHLVQMQLVSRQTYNVESYEDAYADEFPGQEFEEASGPPNDYNAPNADGALGGNPAFSPYLSGNINPPLPNERGWKDTYVMYPGEVTTFIVRFAPTDVPVNASEADKMFTFNPAEGPGYVWHCHILDHEDNEMMRPYKVEPSPLRPAAALAVNKSGSIGSENKAVTDALLNFELDQNYPNPFAGETQIRFHLPEDMHAQLSLLNLQGQTVQILHDRLTPRGNHTVRLNATGLSKGIYFYRLTAGQYATTKRLVVN